MTFFRVTLPPKDNFWFAAVLAACVTAQACADGSVDANRISPDGVMISLPLRTVPVTHRADVVVVGAGEGGLGGCTAAIAAARRGASVILVEERGYIGLHVPIALGVVIGIKGWTPTLNEGLLREYAETTARTGQYNFQPITPEQILDRGEIIVRHHDVASTAMLDMLQKAGVTMLFHAKLVDAVVENGQVKAIIVESPQGRHAIAGKVFVDSTGLGDLAAMTGAPMQREEAFMSVQAFIGGVDEEKYNRWVKENKQPLDGSFKPWMEKLVGPFSELHYPWDQWWPEYLGKRMPPAAARKAREAQKKGELTIIHRRGKDGVLGIVEGIKANTDVAMPRTYVTGVDPLNVDDVSWAETTSRLALMEFQQFLLKYIPGFEKSTLERVADTVSLRGGRYIEIDNPITRDQIDRGATNPDCIFVFSRGKEKPFEVPYRALIPKKIDGLLVVGKATGGGVNMRQAHGVLLQGQAAGIAAATAVKEGIPPRRIDIAQLQTELKAEGIVIPYPHSDAK
jgi:hypothetical protein